jgi:hypothetical protein
MALLIVWILFLLWIFGMLALFGGIIAYGHASEGVEYANLPTVTAATMPVYPPGGYYYVPAAVPSTVEEIHRRDTETVMICAGCVLLGMIGGGVVAVCMWHARGVRRIVAFLPPVAGVGVALSNWMSDPTMRKVHEIGEWRMGLCFALQCAGVLLGLRLGRPIARVALGIMIPPRARQHLACLWTTDGKLLKV